MEVATAASQIVYDVSRDWHQILVPIVFTTGWLFFLVVVIRVMRKQSQRARDRLFGFVWLTGWIGLGGFGFGNVWYQHFHCIRELKSGDFLVAEGPITFFRPEVGKVSEKFTVCYETFEYYSANLGGGGMRYSAGAGGPLHPGAYVRVFYDRNRMILRLEVRQPDQ